MGCIVALLAMSGCKTSPTLTGVWEVDKEQSSDLEPWRNIELRITANDDNVAIGRVFNPGNRDTRRDSITFPTNDTQIEIPMEPSAKWLEQPHMGVFIDGKTPMQVRGSWVVPGHSLNVQQLVELQTSQGTTTVEILRHYQLSEDGMGLTVVEDRSSRPDQLTYVYKRK